MLAERSGLAALAGHPYLSVAPGIVPQNQLWWCLPTLLRNDDVALLGGWSWDQALVEALDRAAGPRQLWGRVHQPRFRHPLSAQFPEAGLDPASLPLPGDGDTVQAIGLLPSAGPAATYGALARYAFDVGDWDNSFWAVFHGVSGRPGSPHYADQNALWSGCRMAPMRYSWALIAEEATVTQILDPGEPA